MKCTQLNLARKIGDNRSTGTALFNFAICQGLQGNIDDAISLGDQSLQILEQIDDKSKNVVKESLEKWKKAFPKGSS